MKKLLFLFLLLPTCSVLSMEHPAAAAAEAPKYICGVCHQSLSSQYCLNQHTLLHTGQPFVCNFAGCNKRFIKQFNLDQHLRTVHMLVLPHKCQISNCRMSFSKRHSLEVHKSSQHKNYKVIEMSEEAAAAADDTDLPDYRQPTPYSSLADESSVAEDSSATDFTENEYAPEERSPLDEKQECNLRELPELTPEEIVFLFSLTRKTFLDLPDDMEL